MHSLVIGRIRLTAAIFTDRPTHKYPNTLHFINEVSHRDVEVTGSTGLLQSFANALIKGSNPL